MRRKAQSRLSENGQQALGQYMQVLQQYEDISPVTIRNYLSDFRLFIVWCEDRWCERQEEHSFTPHAVASTLLIRYREYPQTLLNLRPSTVNRTLMSDEEARVATVHAVGIFRDQTIITLLLHTGLRMQEMWTLIFQSKQNGTLRILGKRKKIRGVPLNTTASSALNQYLETLPLEGLYLFPSEKTHGVLTERARGHLVTKYAAQAQVTDLSPHDLHHRFDYRMAEVAPLHQLAQIMGHDSLDTTMLYVRGTKQNLQQDVEKIAWI